jgi:hypothetical protein
MGRAIDPERRPADCLITLAESDRSEKHKIKPSTMFLGPAAVLHIPRKYTLRINNMCLNDGALTAKVGLCIVEHARPKWSV